MSVNEIDDLLEVAACVLDNVALRDAGALAAAVGRPRVTILDVDACPTSDDKAASLPYSLVRNHSLVDANQPLAWAATRVICILNGAGLGLLGRRRRGAHAGGRRRAGDAGQLFPAGPPVRPAASAMTATACAEVTSFRLRFEEIRRRDGGVGTRRRGC